MKYFINNFLYLFIICIFILIFSIQLININSNNINSNNINENFTPTIRAFYRPLFRKTRIVGEGFYNKTSSNINTFFRKFGIM